MAHRFGFKGNLALIVSHCAGMLDLVALPLWIGVLVASYHFDAQKAGALVTLFLIGAVCASVLISPRFDQLNRRWVAFLGFAFAGLSFLSASYTTNFVHLALIHLVAGCSASCALSMTHGTFARGHNPHRLFAIAGFALGIMGFLFMGAVPSVIQNAGGHSLFVIFAVIMFIAALGSSLAFPHYSIHQIDTPVQTPHHGKIPKRVWYGIFGISLMAIIQAMTFSFMQQVGQERGFQNDVITVILVALTLINIFAAALAGIFQRKLSASWVLMIGPVLQITLSNIIMNAQSLLFFTLSSVFFVAIMIFTHTFVFGLLATLDTSGRAMAATPAMLMVGAAVGPILGGTLIKYVGYPSIGVAALIFGVIALFCFVNVFNHAPAIPESKAAL